MSLQATAEAEQAAKAAEAPASKKPSHGKQTPVVASSSLLDDDDQLDDRHAPRGSEDEDDDDEDEDSEHSAVPRKVALLPGAKAAANSNSLGLESANRAFRDDPLLDRRIIEGMLDDKEGFLDDMHGEGFSREAVVRRAAELGLSEALIRQVKGVAADLAGERPGKRPTPSSLGARTCLQCDRIFFSSGPGNRLCTRCRGGDAGLAQL